MEQKINKLHNENQILEEQHCDEVCQQNIQSQQIEESIDQSEGLRIQAFPIDQEGEYNKQELQAFDYLKIVREQAKQIKKNPPNNRFIKDKNNIKINQGEILIKKCRQQQELQTYPCWASRWKDEVERKWKNIVKIEKSLLNNQNINHKQTQFKISDVPLMDELMFGLSLDAVEKLIIQLSQDYQTDDTKLYQKQYYLWMYSLLSVHQSRANYIIFQALGSINSCILGEDNYNCQVGMVSVILIEHFRQKHLEKRLIKFLNS